MRRVLFGAVGVLAAGPAMAAGIDGAQLGIAWAMPFLGLLLSIAILPQLAHRFWDRHMGALSVAWAAAAIVPLALRFGPGAVLDSVLHVLLAEYLPFVLLLFALYTIAGGIAVTGNLRGSAALNTGLLALGTASASVVGTTGAAMILIRPLIRANDERPRNAHVVVFFIVLVANVGGALSPLGDPPLFLGYLRGIDFFWPTRTLWPEAAFVAAILLALFFALDHHLYRRDGVGDRPDPTPARPVRIGGAVNFILVAGLVGLVVMSGAWRPGIAVEVRGTSVPLPAILRDVGLVVLALLSLALSRRKDRAANDFTWRPIAEVSKIFAGIFVCMVPVTAALAAGRAGAFAPLLALVSGPDGAPNPHAYFWLTGLLSSVLDNAPTYLVFFDLAGGDPARLMGPLTPTLAAISTGAVFMGALTYLGNAPNFMVYAIARQAGVRMPGFGGYLLWSCTILLPVFALTVWLFL